MAELKSIPSCCKMSIQTIQHQLQKHLGLPSCTTVKKLLLTNCMKKQTAASAKKYANWKLAQVTNVMFSQESTFQVFQVRSPKLQHPPSSKSV